MKDFKWLLELVTILDSAVKYIYFNNWEFIRVSKENDFCLRKIPNKFEGTKSLIWILD